MIMKVIFDHVQVTAIAVIIDNIANEHRDDNRPIKHIIVSFWILKVSSSDNDNQPQTEQCTQDNIFLAALK